MYELKKILLVVLFFFATLFVVAQNNEIATDKFRVVHWGVNEGLSAEEGNTVLKDVNGFVWIGSPHGLNRFDGKEFKHYFTNKNKPGSICSNAVNNLIEDSLHNIWMGTDNGMLWYDIKADTFKNIQPANSLYKFIIPFWASKNEVYCIEGSFVITVYNIHSFTKKILIKALPEFTGGPIACSIFDAESNSIWMLESGNENDNGGLFQILLNDGKKNHYAFPVYKNIPVYEHNSSGMCYDKKRNAIWLSSFEGLIEFTLDDKQFHHADAFNKLAAANGFIYAEGVAMDLQDNIWWCTWPNGPLIYNPSTQLYAAPFADKHTQQLIAYSNQYIYCDRDGMIWTTCNQQSKGIFQIIPSSIAVTRYAADTSKPHTLSGNFLNKIINADNGKLWIGQGDELNIFDPATGFFTIISSEKDLPAFHGRLIYPVLIDSIHQKALFDIFSQKTNFSELYQMDIINNHCKLIIFKDSTGKVVSCPTNYDIAPFKNNAVLFSVQRNESRHGIFTVNTGSGTAQWIGYVPENVEGIFATDNDHLLFIKGAEVENNVTYTFENNNWKKVATPIDSIEWTDIYYDKQDQSYWVAGNNEVISYNKNLQLTHRYTTQNGLPEDIIIGILRDKQGNVWLQYKRSILRLNEKTGTIIRLSEIDGLINQAYEANNVIINNGDLYFRGEHGIDRIRPDKFTNNYPASRIYFKSFEINGQPFSSNTNINNTCKLSLHYSENNIVIETGIIDYYSQGKSQIRFKLQGGAIKDTSWQYEPDYYTIRYQQLPPGNYKLTLQASNAANEFNAPAKTLFINISPAFWNTWWFRLIIIAIAAYIIVSIVKWRIQKIKHDAFVKNQLKDLEMKALKAQMNPHFIYNALNSIQALIANNKKEEGIHYIGSFSRLLRQVLENSESNIISLDKELETIGLYIQMEALRLDMRLQYKRIVPKEVVTEFEKMPPLILQPFVENALWHGLSNKQGEKEINISISVQDGWLLCDITDNGIGRIEAQYLKNNSATLHQSKGIDITYKRLVDFNEDISVVPIEFFDLYNDNKTPSGTRVIVRIKRKSSL